jgi:hypothetical protein
MNKKKSNDTELIERYIEGELQGEELEKLENRIKSDPEFASEVKLHRELDEFLRNKFDYIQKREQLEHIYEEVILKKRKSDIQTVEPAKTSSLKWYYKVAAGIALLIGIAAILFFTLRPPKNERLYAQYFKVYDASEIVRGDVQPGESPFKTAMDAYTKKDFETSYKLLDEVCSIDKENSEAFFFKGISAMKIEKFDTAVTSFKVVLSSTSLYIDAAEWYIALCYLGKNDISNAKKVFQHIIINPNNFYKDKACSLLKDIE